MKKLVGVLMVVMLVYGLASCQIHSKQQDSSGAYDLYDGYLSVAGDQLIINDFKFIDLSDQYWIDVLNLTAEDMPNGYYIYDTSDELLSFTLSEETRYNFYDTDAQFVSEDNAYRLYTTTDLNEFLEKFDTDGDGNLSRTPFEVQILEDGRVISISEIFVS